MALLISACLLALMGPASGFPATQTSYAGDAAASVATHAAVALRTLPDRLAPARPLSVSNGATQRHAPPGVLPGALLAAFLLVAGTTRRRRMAATPQHGPLAAAGRGPPATS